MGFLGKLLGNVVGEVMNGALDKAADTISSTVKDKLEDILPITPSYTSTDVDSRKEEQSGYKQAEPAWKRETETTPIPKKPKNEDWKAVDLAAKITGIVSADIVSYSSSRILRTEISPAEIGGIQPYKNYNMGVYENGQPVLLLMVTEHNRANRFYRGARTAAQNAGIPFVNFYTQFPNTEEYIKERLHRYITF